MNVLFWETETQQHKPDETQLQLWVVLPKGSNLTAIETNKTPLNINKCSIPYISAVKEAEHPRC